MRLVRRNYLLIWYSDAHGTVPLQVACELKLSSALSLVTLDIYFLARQHTTLALPPDRRVYMSVLRHRGERLYKYGYLQDEVMLSDRLSCRVPFILFPMRRRMHVLYMSTYPGFHLVSWNQMYVAAS